MKDEPEAVVPWFDLGRFGASLQVVPNSPLRGVVMTCLDIADEREFVRWIAASATATSAGGHSENHIAVWWGRARQLGFGDQAVVYAAATALRGRSARLYSERTSFTLTELQGIVPGLMAADFKPMPIAQILQQLQDRPLHEGEAWRRLAETVLASEAVGVWVPRLSPFAVPFSEARPIGALWNEGQQAAYLEDMPVSRSLVDDLDRARYRENALVPFYVDQASALADGLKPGDVEQCDLPYALPLWVDRSGRVVALRDVRYAPEIMVQSPFAYLAAFVPGRDGIVVTKLRAVRTVVAVYEQELARWREWQLGGEPPPGGEFGASVRRVVEADHALCVRYWPMRCVGLLSLLSKGRANEFDFAGAVCKPLVEWREGEFKELAARVAMFVYGVDAGDVVATLKAVEDGMRAQASAVSMASLQRMAESVQEGHDEPPLKVRHEDAGVKVGGARKDFARRAMSLADLDGMNAYERKTLVVKKNVWPALDYEAMKADGVEPQAAMAIKWLKDHLRSAPERRQDPQHCGHEYVRAVGAVRDAMAEVKTLDEFVEVAAALCKAGRLDPNGVDTQYTYSTAMQVQWGMDVCRMLDAATFGVVESKVQRAIGKWVREGQEWDHLIRPKLEQDDADKDQADDAARERELHRPHLSGVERLGGHDWRGGRDVVAQDLIDHFGFRAVEFGNWLPQDERQSVLNMAFDSLGDLASGLSLPPSGISFGGTLALAFGSRGHGGKHAGLAHFEPARFVINLTRLKGAGTLAHEWFHALDFHLGAKAGFLTDKPVARFTGDPMPALVEAMKRRASTPDEADGMFKLGAERAERNVVGWCYGQSAATREVIGTKVREVVVNVRTALYDEALRYFGREAEARLADGETAAWSRPSGVACGGAANGLLQHDLATSVMNAVVAACDNHRALGKVRSKVLPNVNWLVQCLGRLATVDAARDLGVPLGDRFLQGVNASETAYLKAARTLDEKRSKPYWSTDIELFARAGAQYVHYELAGKGVRSDYLVYGSEEDRYAANEYGNPNPGHADRVRMGQHFAAVIEEYRVACVREADVEVVAQP